MKSFKPLGDNEVDELFEGATFGMEYDCGEFDRKLPTPDGVDFCPEEVAAHTNKGIGADPTLTVNLYGGEARIGPAASEAELFNRVVALLNSNLRTDVTEHAGTIHVHVRIPKLLEQPDLIRHLVHWSTAVWPEFKDIYQWNDKDQDDYTDWLEQCNRMVKTEVYSEHSLARLDASDTTDPKEMALLLHNHPKTRKDWKDEWLDLDADGSLKVKRPAVNFGHLAINETIEFRPFMVTTDEQILKNIIAFPLQYIRMGLTMDPDPTKIMRGKKWQDWNEFKPLGNVPLLTSGYFNCQQKMKSNIARLLLTKQITMADLNYPQWFIDKGFE